MELEEYKHYCHELYFREKDEIENIIFEHFDNLDRTQFDFIYHEDYNSTFKTTYKTTKISNPLIITMCINLEKIVLCSFIDYSVKME